MCNRALKLVVSTTSTVFFLLFSGMALAQDPPSDSVARGAMAWHDWTKTDAGGSGVPAGVTNKDYIRCKACHGWDGKGTEGGYARRSREDSRPNAGFGDGDATSRAITRGSVTEAMITRAGTGRTYAQGTGSWVALDATASAANTAAHHNGYTLGNQHPDFSAAAATQAAGGGSSQTESLTATQVTDLAAYLNFADAGWTAYFDAIYPAYNPVLYVIKEGADAVAGKTYYDANCKICHGDPETDHVGLNNGVPSGGMLAYLGRDGKFSEFAQKARWGQPDTIMTRTTIGSPTSQNIADVAKYLQDLGGYGFPLSACLNGAWQGGAAKDGEGFNVEIALVEGSPFFVIFFFTYDSQGDQIYLTAAGAVDGNAADVDVVITDGGLWGAAFDPTLVNRDAWGTGRFVVNDRGTVINMTVTPNAAQETAGFTAVTYDLNRTTTPAVACP